MARPHARPPLGLWKIARRCARARRFDRAIAAIDRLSKEYVRAPSAWQRSRWRSRTLLHPRHPMLGRSAPPHAARPGGVGVAVLRRALVATRIGPNSHQRLPG